jgi:heat shock protein 90kDa beta
MEKLMAAQSGGRENKDDFMTQIMRTSKKTFEINPHHPLIQAMLDMAKRLPNSEDQRVFDSILQVVRIDVLILYYDV